MKGDQSQEMLESVKNDPLGAEQLLDRWIERLAAGVDTPGNGEPLCEYGRALTRATILARAPSHKNLWNEKRIRRVLELLIQAIEASKSTKFYLNCVDRPRDFIGSLKVAYRGDEDAQHLLRQIERDNREALHRAVPLPETSLAKPVESGCFGWQSLPVVKSLKSLLSKNG